MQFSKRAALGAAAIAAIAAAVPALAKPSAPSEPTTCAKDVNLSISQNLLWPPNHKFVPITITASESDGDGDMVDVMIGQITNNDEDPTTHMDINGTGKPDAAAYTDEQGSNQDQSFSDPGSTTFNIALAAERSGHDNGSGRTYDIPVTCTESGSMSDPDETSLAPATSTVHLKVFVPHDQGNNVG
jgi:hypothetical protein